MEVNGTEAGDDSNLSQHVHGNVSMTNDTDKYEQFFMRAQFITGLILYPIFCFFGLSGNILSIIVLSHRKMKSSTNVYLIGLAVSDTIKLINDTFYFIVILLFYVDYRSGQGAYGYLYPYAHYFFNMSVCTTAWLTVTVAAERYIMVCHATRARVLCSIKRAQYTTIAVFAVTSLLTIPSGLRYKTVSVHHPQFNDTVDVSVTDLWRNEDFVKSYTWIQNLLRSIIPLLILCTLNCFIVQALRKTRSTKKKLSARHRITLMLVSVIMVFLICVTPDAVMSTFFGYGYTDANYLVRGIREITDFLLLVNSAVNFVLYCTFNKVFRKNFIGLFCTHFSRGPLQGEATQCRRSSIATMMNGSKRHSYAPDEATAAPMAETLLPGDNN